MIHLCVRIEGGQDRSLASGQGERLHAMPSVQASQMSLLRRVVKFATEDGETAVRGSSPWLVDELSCLEKNSRR
jgi:hypothetical protein